MVTKTRGKENNQGAIQQSWDFKEKPIKGLNKQESTTSDKKAVIMGGFSGKKGRERSDNFQINCVANTIRGKESRGVDCTFERGLLKAWSSVPGWEYAKEALRGL